MFFFFQAEDGIRDVAVTGVQTCALPICRRLDPLADAYTVNHWSGVQCKHLREDQAADYGDAQGAAQLGTRPEPNRQIGRASCRERVEISVVAVSLKKKKRET